MFHLVGGTEIIEYSSDSGAGLRNSTLYMKSDELPSKTAYLDENRALNRSDSFQTELVNEEVKETNFSNTTNLRFQSLAKESSIAEDEQPILSNHTSAALNSTFAVPPSSNSTVSNPSVPTSSTNETTSITSEVTPSSNSTLPSLDTLTSSSSNSTATSSDPSAIHLPSNPSIFLHSPASHSKPSTPSPDSYNLTHFSIDPSIYSIDTKVINYKVLTNTQKKYLNKIIQEETTHLPYRPLHYSSTKYPSPSPSWLSSKYLLCYGTMIMFSSVSSLPFLLFLE